VTLCTEGQMILLPLKQATHTHTHTYKQMQNRSIVNAKISLLVFQLFHMHSQKLTADENILVTPCRNVSCSTRAT